MAEVVQAFSWLCAVFRLPRYGGISYSDVLVEVDSRGGLKLLLLPLVQVERREVCCWHSLFHSSVIARGFSIPRRTSDQQVGLEIEFGIMANLAAILYPLQCYNGLVMKGISSVLIPKMRVGDSIQWHLVLGSLEKKLSMDDVESSDLEEYYETTDLQQLVQARAFLGLYEKAQIYLGTKESGFGNLEMSPAPSESNRYQLSNTSMASMGVSASGIWNFTMSTKFTKQKGLRVVEEQSKLFLESRLQNSQSQPVLIFDVGDSRGWMVPELSAMLHITHASISRHPDLAPLLNSMPCVLDPTDSAAALSAIRDGKRFELRGENESLSGQPQYFIEFVQQTLIGFERRKEKVLTRDPKTTTLSLPIPMGLRKPTLCGWEVEDLITGSMFYERKEVKLEKSAGDWYLICQNRPDLLVLFCQGLGEPIKPSPSAGPHCRSWDPIPVDRGYLVATVQCLEQLAKMHPCVYKGKDTSLQLAPNLWWHRPLGGKLFESCNSGPSGCNRLQEVIKDLKHANLPGPLSSEGAVIFGKAASGSHARCVPEHHVNTYE